MKEVWINHKQVDFGNAARQQKVTPGCALLDSDSDSNEQEEMEVMQETQHVVREEVRDLFEIDHFLLIVQNFDLRK